MPRRPRRAFSAEADAGIDGNGGSSYIDNVHLRDRKAGASWMVADANLDIRRSLCQNWLGRRGDVCAVITDTGIVAEWTKYTPYGQPTSLPAGDTDSDGDYDATDAGAIIAWTSGYDVRYDVNLDGNIDPDDVGDAITINGGGYLTSGYGVLSGTPTTNRKGYAGYEHDHASPAFLTHVRHRAYRMDLGTFQQPDPLGYVDGNNRWAYVAANVILNSDPSGLGAAPCTSGTQLPPYQLTPPNACDRRCTEKCNANRRAEGLSTCVGFTPVSCVCVINIASIAAAEQLPASNCYDRQYSACVRRHEQFHVDEEDCSRMETDPRFANPDCGGYMSEVGAWSESLTCILAIKCDLCKPNERADCRIRQQRDVFEALERIQEFYELWTDCAIQCAGEKCQRSAKGSTTAFASSSF